MAIMELIKNFNFGGIIKMNFINKIVQTLISFGSVKFVLYNDAIDSKVCSIVNHQIIHLSS